MPVDVGIVYCGGLGAGHAVRMMAVAEELEKQGLNVEMTGGGPGEKFLRLNDRSEYSLSNYDFFEDLEEEGVISGARKFPSDLKSRSSDIREWIREKDPEVILADDPLVALIAVLERREYYFVSHWTWKIPEKLWEKVTTMVFQRMILLTCKGFFCPVIWDDKPKGAKEVGPLAPGGVEENLDHDILAVPSGLNDIMDSMVQDLEEEGYDVVKVGSDDWELQPSLQPYIEEADIVICSGYSTIMEAAVAGTPCVINPVSSEQRGVADALVDYSGFKVYSGDIVQDVEEVNEPESRENGAKEIAEHIAKDLSDKRP